MVFCQLDFATRTGFFGWFFNILGIIKMAIGPKYDGKYLHRLIIDLLGETRMKETLTNVVIPTFDVKCVKPIIFSTFKVPSLNWVSMWISHDNFLEWCELMYMLQCRRDVSPWRMLVLLMYVLVHLQHQPFSLHTILKPWITRVHRKASTLLMVAWQQTIQYVFSSSFFWSCQLLLGLNSCVKTLYFCLSTIMFTQ